MSDIDHRFISLSGEPPRFPFTFFRKVISPSAFVCLFVCLFALRLRAATQRFQFPMVPDAMLLCERCERGGLQNASHLGFWYYMNAKPSQ